MKKLKRSRAFELSLDVRDEAFIRPPHDAQRHGLLNRFMRESVADLEAMDRLAARFVPGGPPHRPTDMRSADLSDDEIMEGWQLPLMREMAKIAGRGGGDVLEIGFGRGVSATLLQDEGIRSHTIIECNDHVVERFAAWREGYPDADIRLAHGLWQDVMDDLGDFDAIFFHTYALDEDESIELLAQSITFAAHFFPTAARHLRDGGVFTYLTNEIDSLSRAHQRLLFEHFRAFRLHVVDLEVPTDVRDAWWADSMAVIEVTR